MNSISAMTDVLCLMALIIVFLAWIDNGQFKHSDGSARDENELGDIKFVRIVINRRNQDYEWNAQCMVCKSKWRVYSKVLDVDAEVKSHQRTCLLGQPVITPSDSTSVRVIPFREGQAKTA